MPPLLCPSPFILDQTFPRDEWELKTVAIALGEIQECLEKGRFHLVLTDYLRQLHDLFDWDKRQNMDLLTEIYGLLNQWLLQSNDRLEIMDVASITAFRPHPLPVGCSSRGFAAEWSDEVGKMLVLHDQYLVSEFFIGISCVRAFAGEKKSEYDELRKERAFPLVGPHDADGLADAYEWKVPSDVTRMPVDFESAKRNCFVIGASSVDNPSGDSHYKVHFPNARSWPLDRNIEQVPERFLKELFDITGYPLKVVKYALIKGELPPRARRF